MSCSSVSSAEQSIRVQEAREGKPGGSNYENTNPCDSTDSITAGTAGTNRFPRPSCRCYRGNIYVPPMTIEETGGMADLCRPAQAHLFGLCTIRPRGDLPRPDWSSQGIGSCRKTVSSYNVNRSADIVQKAQFNGMPKVFEWSKTEDLKVLDNPDVVSPSCTNSLGFELIIQKKAPSVQFALAQLYKIKTPSQEKLVNSKITLHVDPSTNLITQ